MVSLVAGAVGVDWVGLFFVTVEPLRSDIIARVIENKLGIQRSTIPQAGFLIFWSCSSLTYILSLK